MGVPWDIPELGRPLALRGRRDAAVRLDVFAPTRIDAWTGCAVVLPAGVTGVASEAPQPAAGDPDGAVVVRAVVVRHGGDVTGRTPWFGVRRRLDALLAADPPAEPLLGVVVEPAGVSLLWVRGTPADVAARLSRPAWRDVEASG